MHQMPSKLDMGEPDPKDLEILSNTETRYAIVGSTGIYMHLGAKKGTLEIAAESPVGDVKIVDKKDLGELAPHYASIISTAEEVHVDGEKYTVASLPYLIAVNRARKQLPTALIELAKSGKVDKALAEEIRCMLKATKQEDEWDFILQLLYDFAPNFLQ